MAAKVYRPPGFRAARAGGPAGRPNAYRRGYGGKRWKRMRRATFLRDNYICRKCGERCVEGHEDERRRPSCDHIVPKPLGGDESGNLQTLCVGCHGVKTRSEQGGGG